MKKNNAVIMNGNHFGSLGLNQVVPFAKGGTKPQSSSTNLTRFEGGGTHEQNPIGGIPIGQNPETGQLQTAEEGETMAKIGNDDFIFSNKYFLSKNDLDTYNLPKNLAGLTMSDASNKISELYKEREGAISDKTKREFLERIAEAQETQKAEEEAKMNEIMQMNADAGYMDSEGLGEEPMVPDEMMDPTAMGMDEGAQMPPMGEMPMQTFAGGGPVGGTTPTVGSNMGANATGIASGVLDLASQTSGNTVPKAGTAALKGAVSGAAVGTMIFPGIGTAIGAGVGAIGGYIGGGIAAKKAEKKLVNNFNNAGKQYADPESFAKGGTVKRYARGGYREFNTTTGIPRNISFTPRTAGQGLANGVKGGASGFLDPINISVAPTAQAPTATSSFKVSNPAVDNKEPKESNLADRLLRAAPVMNNFAQLASMKQPSMRTPVYDQAKAERNYLDTSAAKRDINAQTNRQIASISQMGATPAERRANMLASQIQRNNAVGNVALQAQQYNLGVDDRAYAMDRQTQMENTRRLEQSLENYDKDVAAYDSTRSSMMNTMANSLGAIGLENKHEKTVRNTSMGYDSQGNYVARDASSPERALSSAGIDMNRYSPEGGIQAASLSQKKLAREKALQDVYLKAAADAQPYLIKQINQYYKQLGI